MEFFWKFLLTSGKNITYEQHHLRLSNEPENMVNEAFWIKLDTSPAKEYRGSLARYFNWSEARFPSGPIPIVKTLIPVGEKTNSVKNIGFFM